MSQCQRCNGKTQLFGCNTCSCAGVVASFTHTVGGLRVDGYKPSKRLIDAIIRGEVTEGGLAEAGWVVLGNITEDGIQ